MNPASSAFSVRWDIFLLTLGMCLVTYIPRALPALFGGRLRLQPWAQRFLNLIPCAALTALIFPGILNTDPARPWIGIAGGIAAALPGAGLRAGGDRGGFCFVFLSALTGSEPRR